MQEKETKKKDDADEPFVNDTPPGEKKGLFRIAFAWTYLLQRYDKTNAKEL